MNTTVEMDKAGRLVVPKRLRELLHIGAGARFEVEEKDEGIFLRPLHPEPMLMRRGGLLVMTGGPPVSYDVRMVIEDDRDARMRYISGESKEP